MILLLVLMNSTIGCDSPHNNDMRLIHELESRAANQVRQPTAAIGYLHHFSDESQAFLGVLQARGARGELIEIIELYLVTSAVELHYCEPAIVPASLPTNFERFFHHITSTFITQAYAHVPSSATRLGIPYVENLLGTEKTARIVNSISPPPGAYCKLYVILTPADDDVMNLTSLPLEDIEQKTLLVKGRWKMDPEGEEWHTFELSDSGSYTAALPLLDSQNDRPSINLESGRDHVMILVDKSISSTLFNGLSVDSLRDGSAAPDIMERLLRTLRIYQSDSH